MSLKRFSTLACPNCDFVQVLEMPVDRCQFFYECVNCGQTLKPKAGDCCVFCSYGDTPCPSRQVKRTDEIP